jgi:regulation of enolase protein 1 (concanavalin A-like superfamily)
MRNCAFSKCLRAGLVCISLLMSVAAAAVGDITYKNDETISLDNFPYALTVARIENGNLKVVNNELLFTSYKGTDFFNDMISGKNNDNAPRLIFQPKGDFILSAKFSGKFAGNYDGGALIVYNDIMSSAKLTFEKSRGTQALWSTVTKGPADDVHHRSFTEETMYLKIARKNTMYFFYSSNDGKVWDILRSFVLDKNENTKVGLLVQSPEAEKFTLRISDIRYQAKAFDDYWQGE